MPLNRLISSAPIRWTLQRRWAMITGAILSALLIILLVVGSILLRDWNQQSEQEYQNLKRLDQAILADVNLYLGQLNRHFPRLNCSDKVVRAMHKAEFHSTFLHEFALIVDDQVVCTSSQGRLAEPTPVVDLDIGDPDTGVGFTRSAKVPLLDDTFRPLVRVGRFQAFLRESELPKPQHPWIQLAEFQRVNQQLVYVAGFDGILPQRSLNTEEMQSWYESGYRVSGQCFRPETCALIALDLVSYFKSQNSLISLTVLMLLLGLTLAAAIGAFLYQEFQRPARRISRELDYDSIICRYQPIVSLTKGQVTGCEVLCRWQPSGGKIVMPDEFLPLIEKNNQQAQLTELMIRKALNELKKLGIQSDIRISFNAFPNDITGGTLLPTLRDYASDLLDNITIELTEREVEDKNALVMGIQQLKQAGVCIAIDDFGTGYSNFQHLKDLNIDYLKIDKSFVWSAKPGEPNLLTAIMDIAHQLNLLVVAEGVETEEQNQYLASLGSQFGQGYWFGRPLTIEELAKFIAQHNNPDHQPQPESRQTAS